MNKEELQQKIALYYSKLPPDVQEVFSKMEWLETLKQISAKYSLSDEQIQTLGTETTLVLLGIIHLDEYEKIVKSELGLTQESLEKILAEINESILKNVRPQLSKTFQQNIDELEEKQTPVEGELDERFAGLSEGIRQIIVKSGYYTKLYKISEENKLTVPQMGTLEEITTGVITNSIHPDEFEKRLIKNLGLPEGVVQKITNQINENILKPIREKMEEVYQRPESSAYEIKPARSATSNVADGPQINSAPTASTGIRIIRPITENTESIIDPHTLPNIMSKGVQINTMELKEGDPVIDQKMQPVLSQKLAGSYKAETIKTDHSIGNITKDVSINSSAPKIYPPNADPYREIPE